MEVSTETHLLQCAMHWTEDDDHPFAGIAEKLKRADENIVNLNDEILTFFKLSKYSGFR